MSGAQGALVVVSAGATAALQWYCVDQFDQLCSAGTAGSWSASAPGLSGVGFSSTVTTGSGVTTEYFSTTTSTPPGLYTGTTCLTSYTGTYCVSYLVQVIASINQLITPPQFSLTQTIKLQMAPVLVNLVGHTVQILNFGHLYLELYVNGVAQGAPWPFQAGPMTTGTSTYLAIEQYQQSVYTDPSVDITSYVTAPTLAYYYNNYNLWQINNNLPYYGLTSLNSNSWIDGLLLYASIPQGTINSWVANLESRSLVSPIAYGNGAPLTPCFRGRRYPTIRPHVLYGGCTGQ